jgi:hypothetical protein
MLSQEEHRRGEPTKNVILAACRTTYGCFLRARENGGYFIVVFSLLRLLLPAPHVLIVALLSHRPLKLIRRLGVSVRF